MYSIYIVIYLCIIVNNYDSSKESVVGEFVDVWVISDSIIRIRFWCVTYVVEQFTPTNFDVTNLSDFFDELRPCNLNKHFTFNILIASHAR